MDLQRLQFRYRRAATLVVQGALLAFGNVNLLAGTHNGGLDFLLLPLDLSQRPLDRQDTRRRHKVTRDEGARILELLQNRGVLFVRGFDLSLQRLDLSFNQGNRLPESFMLIAVPLKPDIEEQPLLLDELQRRRRQVRRNGRKRRQPGRLCLQPQIPHLEFVALDGRKA